MKNLYIFISIILAIITIFITKSIINPIDDELINKHTSNNPYNTNKVKDDSIDLAMEKNISQLAASIDDRFSQIESKLDILNKSIDTNFATTSEKVNSLNDRINTVKEDIANNISTVNNMRGLPRRLTNSTSGQDPIKRVKKSSAERHEELVNSFEEKFYSEDIDDNWSDDSTKDIENIFLNNTSPVYETSGISDIECRNKTCKVHIAHNNLENSTDFELEFFTDLAKAGFNKVSGYGSETDPNGYTYFISSKPVK